MVTAAVKYFLTERTDAFASKLAPTRFYIQLRRPPLTPCIHFQLSTIPSIPQDADFIVIKDRSMSLAIVLSRAQVGVEAPAVTVEAHLANGLPALTLVGLPEGAVKESKDRVRSAILNSGLEFPARRITLNLAPADLPKDGGRFDLAIALGILSASVQVPTLTLDDVECLGELALSGDVRAVRGVLPAALAAREAGRMLVVPRANAEEAWLASGLNVFAVDHLLQAVAHFNGHTPIEPYVSNGLLYASMPYPDLNEVQGQLSAKRALLIAAAGAHNLLFSGPPGTGKTLLASRLPGLLPPLSEQEALEVAAIQSVVSLAPLSHWPHRPMAQWCEADHRLDR